MFSLEALQFLQSQMIAASNPVVTPEHMPYMVLPNTTSIQSMESYLKNPVRFRGTFRTRRVADFVGYVDDQSNVSSPDPAVFIDPEKIEAVAIFGLGDEMEPGWGEHSAVLAPKMMPAYAALLAMAYDPVQKKGHEFNQLDFIDFIGDWKDCFTAWEDTEEKSLDRPTVIHAIRNIQVQAKQEAGSSVTNFSGSRTAMESIDVQGQHGRTLPESFTFTCKPYEEFTAREFECVLRAVIDTNRNTAKLVYRITALDSIKLEIADEFLALIQEAVKAAGIDDVSLRIGTFARK